MLKAIIFDMDDTLVDWSKRSQDWQEFERLHLGLVLSAIAQETHSPELVDQFMREEHRLAEEAWIGAEAKRGGDAPHIGTIMRQALENIGIPHELIDIEACLKAYDWQPMGGLVPFPDVSEVLPILASHGIKIGMITNAFQPMWMRDVELAAFGLLEHFAECRISAADFGKLKPHPAIFEAALNCLGVQPDEAVFIGDSHEADIVGAQGVGMRAVLRIVEKPMARISGLVVPDGAVNTLHELLPLLDKWYPDWRNQDSVGVTPTGAVNGFTADNPLS
ncbi:MAG: HAD family hydrolase [Chloroflexota bacterium]